jgi:hypothetical protein
MTVAAFSDSYRPPPVVNTGRLSVHGSEKKQKALHFALGAGYPFAAAHLDLGAVVVADRRCRQVLFGLDLTPALVELVV